MNPYSSASSLLLREQDGRRGAGASEMFEYTLGDMLDKSLHQALRCSDSTECACSSRAVHGICPLGDFASEDAGRRAGMVLNSPSSVPTPIFAAQFNKVRILVARCALPALGLTFKCSAGCRMR